MAIVHLPNVWCDGGDTCGAAHTHTHITYQLSPNRQNVTPIAISRGDCWSWVCEAGCGRQSFATFATQDEARNARLQHEKGCTCPDKR